MELELRSLELDESWNGAHYLLGELIRWAASRVVLVGSGLAHSNMVDAP
jgi:hypothetical protein